MLVHYNPKSSNTKTGPIPVTTSPRSTCPTTCPLKGKEGGCYAEGFHLGMHWDRVDKGTAKNLVSWDDLCAKIAELPEGQLWRHNQAGDLPKLG